MKYTSQIFHRRSSSLASTPIGPARLFAGILISFEHLYFKTIHILHDVIRLPLLKRRSEAFVRVVFVVGLVLVVLDANEIAVDSGRVKGQANEGVDDSRLGDDLERPRLNTS